MRDHGWLEDQLQFLLKTYFADVLISNPIQIKFGREAKYRFGSIKLLKHKGLKIFRKDSAPQKSIITITSVFAREHVPAGVVRYTIAHELCHYAHGFSSMNKQMFRHPHHGGIVNRELTQRGADDLIREFKAWLKGYRKAIMAARVKI
jgi:hypothetical protein